MGARLGAPALGAEASTAAASQREVGVGISDGILGSEGPVSGGGGVAAMLEVPDGRRKSGGGCGSFKCLLVRSLSDATRRMEMERGNEAGGAC